MKHNSTAWNNAIDNLTASGEGYVLITLLGVRGSAPRNAGTKMVITANATFDTIGGGHLELKAMELAQNLLQNANASQHIEHFPLGPALGQCCGGSTSVLFEVFQPNEINLMVFGAGHVAQALMPVLAQLPCNIRWVDNREHMFPDNTATHIKQINSQYPTDEISSMPEGSYFLVMTHNHQLDFDICEKILKRGDFNYLGLIASDTKWARFQKRFDFKNISPELVARMSSPVGLSSVPGKLPMEVAVSIAGEIIACYQSDIPEQPTQQGLHWNELKTILTPSSSDVVIDTAANTTASIRSKTVSITTSQPLHEANE